MDVNKSEVGRRGRTDKSLLGTVSVFRYGERPHLALTLRGLYPWMRSVPRRPRRTLSACICGGRIVSCSGHLVVLCRMWLAILVLSLSACVHPALTAKEQALIPVERVFDADANQTYYAIRWALAAVGYPVGSEDLPNGLIATTWISTRAGAQYFDPFERQEQTARDWGNNSGYYKMAFQVHPDGGGTRVTVTAYVRSVVANLNTSGEQENLVLNKVGDYLRGADPDVTNVGIKQ